MFTSASIETLQSLQTAITWITAAAGVVTAIGAVLMIPISNQITELSSDRSLSKEQVQVLSENLPIGPFEPPFSLTVMAPLNDREAQSFAKEIGDVIHAANWEAVLAPNGVLSGDDAMGTSISFNPTRGVHLRAHAEALATALSEVELFDMETLVIRERVDLRDADILLIVGHK